MINVSIWQSKQDKKIIINKIIVYGHTEKAENTIESVCAATSAVVLGTVNNLIKLKLIDQNLIIKKKDGYLSFTNQDQNPTKQLLLSQMIVQLQTVEKYFNNKIKIQFKNAEN